MCVCVCVCVSVTENLVVCMFVFVCAQECMSVYMRCRKNCNTRGTNAAAAASAASFKTGKKEKQTDEWQRRVKSP